MRHYLLLLSLLALVGCSGVGSDPVQITTAFSYTAPGDDDWTGQAALTQMRMALTAAALTDDWSACLIVSEHVPWAAGVLDTFTVNIDVETNVDYYFAVKVADEVPNWSNVSNIIMRNYPDVTPPGIIGDLNFAD